MEKEVGTGGCKRVEGCGGIESCEVTEGCEGVEEAEEVEGTEGCGGGAVPVCSAIMVSSRDSKFISLTFSVFVTDPLVGGKVEDGVVAVAAAAV
jgi:hypothetical protein